MDVDLGSGIAGLIIGAILGGFTTLVVTPWVEQQALARSKRVHMYEELLPKLTEQTNALAILTQKDAKALENPRVQGYLETAETQAHLLSYTAAIAGSADQERAERIQSLIKQMHEIHVLYAQITDNLAAMRRSYEDGYSTFFSPEYDDVHSAVRQMKAEREWDQNRQEYEQASHRVGPQLEQYRVAFVNRASELPKQLDSFEQYLADTVKSPNIDTVNSLLHRVRRIGGGNKAGHQG